ncbi:MAG: 50S ribosomal protein L4 [Acholeplasmatales bacterium]|jgi:large subunit ribosomal protein L4|nr:50S ribosomal protein L4 [Acholeplasmatales bacterium]
MQSLELIKNDGTKGVIDVNEYVFGITPHQQAVYDTVVAQQAAMRQGTAETKNRAAVSGGGRKPYRQKGTGRARQGSTRSPQWYHGGIVWGPHPRKYIVKLNQKVRQLALRSALSYHVQNKSLVVLESINIKEVKTKNVVDLLAKLNVSGKTLLVDLLLSDEFVLSARNIAYLAFSEASHASVYDILNCKTLVLTTEAVKYFEGVLSNE